VASGSNDIECFSVTSVVVFVLTMLLQQ
jgi:hypothetical protein